MNMWRLRHQAVSAAQLEISVWEVQNNFAAQPIMTARLLPELPFTTPVYQPCHFRKSTLKYSWEWGA
jgi:hypothetical protein